MAAAERTRGADRPAPPAGAADRELVFTRTLDAPRELVFEAWTEPQHVAHWWGPTGFTTTIHEMQVRPGGVWRLTMHGPDGVDYENRIVFVEVARPERLVYRHEPAAGTEPVRFETTVTFADRGGRTELTMRMLFPSAAERDHVVKQYGAVEGAQQTLGRLARHLETMPGARPAPQELVLTRVFDAPPQVVFAAWTEPDQFARWWGPRGVPTPVCEFDARPGGAIRWCMRLPDGRELWHAGVFREVVAAQRLVFTLFFTDAAGRRVPHHAVSGWPADAEFVTTVTFAAHGGGTALTIHQVVEFGGAPVPHTFAAERAMARRGWSESLDRLAASVDPGVAPAVDAGPSRST